MIRRFLLLLAVLPAIAQSPKDIGDVRFMPLEVERGGASMGYTDQRAMLQNNSSENRTVSVELTGNSGGLCSARRTVTLAAKARAELTIPCPPHFYTDHWNIRIIETGKRKRINAHGSTGGISWRRERNNDYSLLVLSPLDDDRFLSCLKPKAKRKAGSSHIHTSSKWDNSDSHQWTEGINRLSKIWQGLARYNVVAVTVDKLISASPESRSTLIDYMLSGGTLVVYGTTESPLEFQPDSSESDPGVRTLNYGFGGMLLLEAKSLESFKEKQAAIVANFIERRKMSDYYVDPLTVHRVMPVVPNIMVPLRGTFLLMLIFSILAGPVLVIVLARRNKRIMLNWAIPALSLITSAILVIYALASEGITTHVRHSGISYLNQIDKRAATLGSHGYYTPFIPSKGLLFGTTSEIVKYKESGFMPSSAGSYNIDWNNGQRFASGWIAPRVPEYFSSRTVERRRERIEFTRDAESNTLSIVNGLGADIRNLTVMDEEEAIFVASSVKAGESVELKPGNTNPFRSANVLCEFMDNNFWIARSDRATTPFKKIRLNKGTYLAELEGAPFMENGLNYKDCELKGESIVYGVWEVSNGR